MAYYLGRDIDIALTTEHEYYSIGLITTSTSQEEAGCMDHRVSKGSNSTKYEVATHKDKLFAGPRSTGADTAADDDNPWAGSITGDSSPLEPRAWTNVPKNITGLDLSFGVQDEEIAFVGQRSVLKAEIKKDNSVTITRKKNDNVWAVIYNDARFGLAEIPTNGYYNKTGDTTSPFHIGLDAPDYINCGYRVYLRFGGSTTSDEIFVLKNAYITDYSVTLGADSSQEESLTLQSYLDPIIHTGAVSDTFDAPTTVGEL